MYNLRGTNKYARVGKVNLFQQMMTFIEVVKAHSFTKAADKLALTTTAVSKQIKLLEQHMGELLLERSTRQVKLTDLGRQFYVHCKKMQEDMFNTEQFISQQKTEPEGTLKILISGYFANYLLDHLYEFHSKYQKLKLNIEVSERLPDLKNEDVDVMVGFCRYHYIPDHLRFREIMSFKQVLVAAPKYLERHGHPKTLSDLKKCLLISHSMCQQNNEITFANGRTVVVSQPILLMNSYLSLIKACRKGFGLFQAAQPLVQGFVDKGELVHILPAHKLPDTAACLYYKPTPYQFQKIRCFIDFLMRLDYSHV